MFEMLRKRFSDYKEKNQKYKKNILVEKSGEIYQVKEFEGKLWFTFNGQCVCPCEMLKGEPIEMLKEMREFFVARNI